MADSKIPDSYTNTQSRFDQQDVADEYVIRKNSLNTDKNRREMACIQAGLDGLPGNARVLDLPCGSGRLETMLLERGYNVVAADYAQAMLNAAQSYHQSLLENDTEKAARLTFQQEDILNTSFEDQAFDAVICNRLIHHYPEASLRQQVLAELKRISRDRIIVSFFSNTALSAFRFHLSNVIRGITPDDRIPIWYSEFEKDIQQAGLRVSGFYPVRRGVSPQTYLKLVAA